MTNVDITPHEAFVLVQYVMRDIEEKGLTSYRYNNGHEIVLEDLAEKLVQVLKDDLDDARRGDTTPDEKLRAIDKVCQEESFFLEGDRTSYVNSEKILRVIDGTS